MNAKHPVLSVFITLLLALFACSEDGTSGGELSFDFPDSNLSFSADIRPIFLNSCALAGCHTTPDPQNGLDLGALEPTFTNSFGQPVVIFRLKEGSRLWRLIQGPYEGFPQMPLQGRLLVEEEIRAIGTWIDEGADIFN